jgi:COP9 signalosome complex subunit 3
MERFDPVQTRYAGVEFRRLFGLIAEKIRLLHSRPAQQAMTLSTLGSAILRVDPSGATFTSSHLVFVRKCLEARAYSEALPVLNQSIFYFPPTTKKGAEHSLYPHLSSNHESSSTFITSESCLSAKLDYRDHLQYFLYGAMCYIGLKEWKRALLFLEMVIISPVVNNASKIQVEAYKKFLLVGLLYKGYVSRASTWTAGAGANDL